MHAGILAVLQAAVAGSIVVLSRWEFRPFRVERTEAQHFTDSSPRQRVWHFHVPCLLELRAKIRAIGKWRNANEMGGPAETGGQIARASQAKFAAELLDERMPSKGSPSRVEGERQMHRSGGRKRKSPLRIQPAATSPGGSNDPFWMCWRLSRSSGGSGWGNPNAFGMPRRLQKAQLAAGDTYWVPTLKLPHPQTQLSLILIARPMLSSSKV